MVLDLRRYRSNETRAAAVFLAHCAPEAAVEWLKSRPVEYRSGVFCEIRTPDDAHLLEYILLRRRSPLIDGGLAQHGRSRSVLQRLYRSASTTVRALACSNASLFVGSSIETADDRRQPGLGVWDVLRSGSRAELAGLCGNRDLEDSFFLSVLRRAKAPASELADGRYREIIQLLTGNPRLSTREEDAHWAPSRVFVDYGMTYYPEVFDEGWALADHVPVTREWARTLCYFLTDLVPHISPNRAKAIIERWQVEAPQDDSYEGDYFEGVRECLARNIKPSLEMLDSPDSAMRKAFYANFDPAKREFANLDWSAWPERDEYCEVWLRSNLNVWKSEASREKLRALVPDELSWFRADVERYREKHPEWFKDSFDPPEQPATHHAILSRLGALEQKVAAIADFLVKSSKRKTSPLVWIGLVIAGALASLALSR